MDLEQAFAQKYDEEILVFFYRSTGVNWRSPALLTLSSGISKLLRRPRAIGHVSVWVRSKSLDRELFTGMTQSDPEEGRSQVLSEGYGLGILFHAFKGRLEEKTELFQELNNENIKKRVSALRFCVSASATQRALGFIDAFRERGANQVYGMPMRPRYGEGGGCSAFVAAVLEVSGLLHEKLKAAWSRDFLIPRNLIGGPRTRAKISVWRLIFGSNWATELHLGEPGFFWDPDLMYAWQKKIWQAKDARSVEALWPNSQPHFSYLAQFPLIDVECPKLIVPDGPLFLSESS